MSMKWEKTGDRTVEVVFDNGVKMLLVDTKPCAAVVPRNKETNIVIRSQRFYPEDVERLISQWVDHQPVISAIVPQATLQQLWEKEGQL